MLNEVIVLQSQAICVCMCACTNVYMEKTGSLQSQGTHRHTTVYFGHPTKNVPTKVKAKPGSWVESTKDWKDVFS